jgi:Tfp pilus assembly protein PilX
MKNKQGQIIIVGIIFLSVVLILASTLFGRVSSFMNFSATSIINEQATNLAEAGLEKAFWQLNQTAGSYTGETNTLLGSSGTFTVSIVNTAPNLKIITSTGYVPNAANPKSKRTIKVEAIIDNAQISFHYAVQVGGGGLTMSNNSTVNGSIYSSKIGVSITGTNGSIINGDAWVVGTISSPDPTILGTTNENQTQIDMPTFDTQPWQDAAAAGGIVNCPTTCTLTTGNLGPKKYVGNVQVTNGNIMTLKGPVYITGNLIVDNNGTVNLDNPFGSNGTVMIVDGTVTVSNNGAFNPTNASPKGYILVASNSTSTSAMDISNNGANATFYALFGGALLENNSSVTALVAYSVTMKPNSTLNYDQGLANANFTSGPGASWLMHKGTYKAYQ